MTYRVIEGVLVAGVIVDVDRDIPEGGNFAGQTAQECIILPSHDKSAQVSDCVATNQGSC